MPNPDSGNLPSKLANSPSTKRKSTRGSQGTVNEKTADWPGLPGKTGPDRTNGVKKAKIYPTSIGI